MADRTSSRSWARSAWLRWFTGLFVFGIVALLPVGAIAQPPSGGPSRLGGVVTDDQGNPIKGARTHIRSLGRVFEGLEPPNGNDFSDADGRYGAGSIPTPDPRFEDGTQLRPWLKTMAPGRYLIVAQKAGFEEYTAEVDVAGDTTHDVVLKRKIPWGITLIISGGGSFVTFPNAEDDVCTKFFMDSNAAGYEASSCTGNGSSTGWIGGLTVDWRGSGKFGFFGGVKYLNLGGFTSEYQATRVANQLFYQGTGTVDLQIWQLTVGPSIRIANNLIVLPGVNVDFWRAEFDILNQLRAAGQLVSESNASGNESGVGINFGAAIDWRPASSRFGFRLDAQYRRLDDVVTTSVFGLPRRDSGVTISASSLFIWGRDGRAPAPAALRKR